MFPPDLAGDALTAALRLLAGTDALLLDLRGTEGGSPDGVALLCGWFFAEPTHLHTMHERSGAIRQFWSAAWLPVPATRRRSRSTCSPVRRRSPAARN
ncbi:hypothetical protein V2I01_20610 [Micromonospora sp. BRA006-A]|nr:hypothetical protein [Micromonospora sp. BRA006-A]